LSDEDFGDASSFGGGKKGKRDEDDMDMFGVVLLLSFAIP